MRAFIVVLLFASLAPFPSLAESDVLLEAIGFALTGSENTKVRPINRANCVFGIGDEVFHLNSVQVDRLFMYRVDRKNGLPPFIQVELHGSMTVYERTDPHWKGTVEEFEAVRQMSPEHYAAYKQQLPRVRTSFNERTIDLATNDNDRVSRAFQYIYSHGCAGSKSPF